MLETKESSTEACAPRRGRRSDIVADADADVVVVGGGFVGLATALALGTSGRSVLVLESRSGVDRHFRGELIHPAGVRVLDELGLLRGIEAGSARRCRGFAVTSSRGEESQLLDYPATAAGMAGGLVMHHTDLRDLLLDAVAKRNEISLLTGVPVVGVVRERGDVVGVTTRQGTVFRAGLTVVCDGRFSLLRKELGFTPTVSLLSHTLVLTSPDLRLPHPDYGHVFLGGPGPILAYELGDGTVRICVDIPLHLSAMHRRPDEHLVRIGYFDHLPEAIRTPVVDALRTSDVGMSANISVMGRSCWAPGLVLMGDSAMCSHPLTAMGMTAGLHDAIALRNELDRGPDQVTALYRFERRRLQTGWLGQTFTDSLYQTFSGSDEVTRALRRGIFLHWRGSDHARQKTMALLAGEDQRLRMFITQYAGVVYRAMAADFPGGFSHAVHSRIGLLERALIVSRAIFASRCHALVASLRARIMLSTARHRRMAGFVEKHEKEEVGA